MTVDPVGAEHRREHAGNTYFFCSNSCRERFAAEPARYLKATLPRGVAFVRG